MEVLTEKEKQLISEHIETSKGMDAEKYRQYLIKKPMTSELKYAHMKKEALEVHFSILRDDEPNRIILDSELKESFVQNELKTLNEFIDGAKRMVGSFSEKDHTYPDIHRNKKEIIYINIISGHYLKEGAWFTPKEVSKVYAKYFIWKEYLEELLSLDVLANDDKHYFEGLTSKEIAMLFRYLYVDKEKLNKIHIKNILKDVDGQNSYAKIAGYYNNTFKDEFNRVNHPAPNSQKSVSDHENRFVNVIKKLNLIGNKKGLDIAKKEYNLFQTKNS